MMILVPKLLQSSRS
ncbi:hypothetical protein LINPERHAP1_LOCUS24234 [Linum perenne]